MSPRRRPVKIPQRPKRAAVPDAAALTPAHPGNEPVGTVGNPVAWGETYAPGAEGSARRAQTARRAPKQPPSTRSKSRGS
jgi:hypothetical protein